MLKFLNFNKKNSLNNLDIILNKRKFAQKNKTAVGGEGFDESLVGVQDEKKDNNELQSSDEELESSKPETLSPLIEDTELLIDKEPQLPVDTSESINEAIKQDIIDSLPEKDDAGYFDLLLEKIGF